MNLMQRQKDQENPGGHHGGFPPPVVTPGLTAGVTPVVTPGVIHINSCGVPQPSPHGGFLPRGEPPG